MSLKQEQDLGLAEAANLQVQDLFNVKGKHVLVSGGGRGIGQMIATGFVRNGATVYISSRDEKAISATADELTKLGPGKCYGLATDLAQSGAPQKLIEQLKSKYNVTKLHVLINNSGNSWGEPLEKFSEKGWKRVMELNVEAMFFLTKAALPLLEAAAQQDDPARIINIGSVAGVRPQSVPTWSYDVSKAAVHHLTNKFAGHLAGRYITCNAIAPGFVPSRMSKQLLTYASEDTLKNAIPLKRFAKPQDMAGPALFFASAAGAWTTGTVLVVDGGQMAVPPKMLEEDSTKSKL